MFIAALWFAAMYLIIGTAFRLFTVKFPDNPVAKAITFAH
jgi:hypothetical protein